MADDIPIIYHDHDGADVAEWTARAAANLPNSLRGRDAQLLLAFYSSAVGAISTNPALMNLPVDDHMVHRGHAVFDTANARQRRWISAGNNDAHGSLWPMMLTGAMLSSHIRTG